MPPKENPNKNSPLGAFRIGIDPVFKGNPNLQKPQSVETEIKPASAFNVLNNQEYIPSTPKPTPTGFSGPINNNTLNNKSVVRTFKGDLESAIAADHLSSINIAIAENEKMRNQIGAKNTTETGEAESVPSQYSLGKVIIFIGFILIIAGIAGIIGVSYYTKVKQDPVIQTVTLPSLITVEHKGEIALNTIAKNKFVETLSTNLIESQIPLNSFYNIYLTTGTSTEKRLITAGEFVTLAKFEIPDIIKRNLIKDFMVGTYSAEKNWPFVILKTASFENTYAGMLNWERSLEKDFQLLFRLPGYDIEQNILTELEAVEIKKFEDKVILNKDTRILKGNKGEMILIYGIIDQDTIVITVSDKAFKEIVDRLEKEKAIKR